MELVQRMIEYNMSSSLQGTTFRIGQTLTSFIPTLLAPPPRKLQGLDVPLSVNMQEACGVGDRGKKVADRILFLNLLVRSLSKMLQCRDLGLTIWSLGLEVSLKG